MVDDGEGSNVLGELAEVDGIPRVRSGSSSGLAADTSSYPARRGAGVPG